MVTRRLDERSALRRVPVSSMSSIFVWRIKTTSIPRLCFESISAATLKEAKLANGVAENIQHIFAVTEQTGEGTRTTAHQVRELSRMAEELHQSVARFRIA